MGSGRSLQGAGERGQLAQSRCQVDRLAQRGATSLVVRRDQRTEDVRHYSLRCSNHGCDHALHETHLRATQVRVRRADVTRQATLDVHPQVIGRSRGHRDAEVRHHLVVRGSVDLCLSGWTQRVECVERGLEFGAESARTHLGVRRCDGKQAAVIEAAIDLGGRRALCQQARDVQIGERVGLAHQHVAIHDHGLQLRPDSRVGAEAGELHLDDGDAAFVLVEGSVVQEIVRLEGGSCRHAVRLIGACFP